MFLEDYNCKEKKIHMSFYKTPKRKLFIVKISKRISRQVEMTFYNIFFFSQKESFLELSKVISFR